MWLRDLGSNKIGAVVLGKLRDMLLEEYGKDKIVRENN